MPERRKIIILTTDAGFGHRSAANAIHTAIQQKYSELCESEIVNPMDDTRVPGFVREATQSDYDKIVRNLPDLYKLNYQISDSPVPTAVLERALTVLLFPVIRSLVKVHQPDAFITTHPFYMAPLNAYLTLRRIPIPFLTVITDLTNIHRLWFNQGSDYCLLPTDEAYHEALDAGLAPEMCRVTGIPVNPAFALGARKKSHLRKVLGWDANRITALVVGSKRIKNLMQVLHVLNHSGLPIQLVLIAGGDEKLLAEFHATDWHMPTYIYPFVDRMPEFMKASDIYIGKSGGLSITESLACGLALLLVDLTPGQEEGNAHYVISHGAGELAQNPVQALEILCHWLQKDHFELTRRSRIAAGLGRPLAAFEAADLAFQAAEKGRSVPSSRLLSWIPKFRELLRAFDLSDTSES